MWKGFTNPFSRGNKASAPDAKAGEQKPTEAAGGKGSPPPPSTPPPDATPTGKAPSGSTPPSTTVETPGTTQGAKSSPPTAAAAAGGGAAGGAAAVNPTPSAAAAAPTGTGTGGSGEKAQNKEGSPIMAGAASAQPTAPSSSSASKAGSSPAQPSTGTKTAGADLVTPGNKGTEKVAAGGAAVAGGGTSGQKTSPGASGTALAPITRAVETPGSAQAVKENGEKKKDSSPPTQAPTSGTTVSATAPGTADKTASAASKSTPSPTAQPVAASADKASPTTAASQPVPSQTSVVNGGATPAGTAAGGKASPPGGSVASAASASSSSPSTKGTPTQPGGEQSVSGTPVHAAEPGSTTSTTSAAGEGVAGSATATTSTTGDATTAVSAGAATPTASRHRVSRSPKKEPERDQALQDAAVPAKPTGPISITDLKAMSQCLDSFKAALVSALGDEPLTIRTKLLELFDAIARAAGHQLGYLEEDEFAQALESLKTRLTKEQVSAVFRYFRRPGKAQQIDYRRLLVDIGYDRQDSQLVDSLQNSLQSLMDTEPALSSKLTRYFNEYDFQGRARQRAEALEKDKGSPKPATLLAHDKEELAKFKAAVSALGGFSNTDGKRLWGLLRRQGSAGADEREVMKLVTAPVTQEGKKKGSSGASSNYASAIVDCFTPPQPESSKSTVSRDRDTTPKGFRATNEIVSILEAAVKEMRTAGMQHINPWVLLQGLLTPIAKKSAPTAGETQAAEQPPSSSSAPRMGIELSALAELFARFDPLDSDAESEQMVQDQPSAFARLAAAAGLSHGEMQRGIAALNKRAEESTAARGQRLAETEPESKVLYEAAALALFGMSLNEDDKLQLSQTRYTIKERLSKEQRIKLGYAKADGTPKPEWTDETIAKDVAKKSEYIMRFSLKAGSSSQWSYDSQPCVITASGSDLSLSLQPGDVPNVPLRGVNASFQPEKWAVLIEVIEQGKAAPVALASIDTTPKKTADTTAPATGATPVAVKAPDSKTGGEKDKGATTPDATTAQTPTKAPDAAKAADSAKGTKEKTAEKAAEKPSMPAETPVPTPAPMKAPVVIGTILLSLRDILSKMLGGASFVGGWMDVYLWGQIVDYSSQVTFSAAPVSTSNSAAVIAVPTATPTASPAITPTTAPAVAPTVAAAGAPAGGATPTPASGNSAPAVAASKGQPTPSTPSAGAQGPSAAGVATQPAAASAVKPPARSDQLQCVFSLQSLFAGKDSVGALGKGMTAQQKAELGVSLQDFVTKGFAQRSPPSAARLALRQRCIAPACTRTLATLAVELVTALLVTPAKKVVPEEPVKVIRPRTAARRAAQQEGNQGGKHVMDETQAAVVLQAAWRSKRVRKKQRQLRRNATMIQKVFRGARQRTKFLATRVRLLELQRAEATRLARLKRIRAKERELTMLRRIPPEEYLHYERLRKDHSARLLQRSWRRLRPQYSASGRTVSRPVAAAPQLDHKTRAKLDAKQAALDAHRKKVEATVTEAASAMSRVKTDDDSLRSRLEVDALGLAQLQRRIKDAAQAKAKVKAEAAAKAENHTAIREPAPQSRQRNDYESAANDTSAARGGVRRRYQDLAEVQHRAAVLCDEYAAQRDRRLSEATHRQKCLAQTSFLLEQLGKCPSLDQSREMILKAEKSGFSGPEWLQGMPAAEIDKAADSHFRTMHSMSDLGSWCLVAAPYDVTGPPIDIARLEKTSSNSPMRARTGRWASGKDGEQSLWWVSYATQPSKYSKNRQTADADDAMADAYDEVTGISGLRQSDRVDEEGAHVPSQAEEKRAQTNAALGIVAGTDLLKKVARDVLAAPRRLETVLAHCESENKRADALAGVYTQQVLARQIKQRHDAKRELLTAHEIKAQERAAVKIQALARRRRASERVGGLLAERRVGRALQVLLLELGKQQQGASGKGTAKQLGNLLGMGLDLGLGGAAVRAADGVGAQHGSSNDKKAGKSAVTLPFPTDAHGTPSRPAYSGVSRNRYIKPSPGKGSPSYASGAGGANTPGGDSLSTLDMSVTPGMGGTHGRSGGATTGQSTALPNDEHTAASSIQRLYRSRSPSKAQIRPTTGQEGDGHVGKPRVSFEADDSRGSIDSPLSMASADPRLMVEATPGGYGGGGVGYLSSPSETMSQSQVSLTLFASPAGKVLRR